MYPAKVSCTAATWLLSLLPDLQEMWCHNSGGFCCFLNWAETTGSQLMCILMCPVAVEMTEEHIAYFQNNRLGNVHSHSAPLPGGFLPRWQSEEMLFFFPQSELKSKPKKKKTPKKNNQRSQVVCWSSSTFSTNVQIWYSLNLYSSCPPGLEDGGAIMKAFLNLLYSLFTMPGWHDMICALRGHNKLLAGQFAESRGWLCLVPVSRN